MPRGFTQNVRGMQRFGDLMRAQEEFAARRYQEAQARQMQEQKMQMAAEQFDFQRQGREEDLAHRYRMFGLQERQFGLQEQQLGLKQRKLERDLQGGGLPFAGNSWDAQVANMVYQQELQSGADDVTARQRAADRVMSSKQTPTMITNPETGRQEIINIPRAGVFGGQPQQAMLRDQQMIGQAVLPQQQAQDDAPFPVPAQTVFDAQGKATGPRIVSGGAMRVLNSITFGEVPLDEAYEASKVTVENAKGMLRAFAQNPRFPDAERKAIEDRMETFNRGVLKGPDAARVQLMSVDQHLRFLRDTAARFASDPRTEVKEQNNYRQKVRDLDSLRAYMLGVGPGEEFVFDGSPQSEDDIQSILDMYAPR